MIIKIIFLSGVCFLIYAIGSFAISYSKGERHGCIESKVVKTIGGCDRSGHCGIVFEDGTSGDPYRHNHPVPGQTLCVKYGKIK